MPKTHTILELHRSDNLLVHIERVEGVCLAAAMVLAAACLVERFVPTLSGSSGAWMEMPLSTSLATLACGAGLALSTTRDSQRATFVRTGLGLATTLAGMARVAAPDKLAEFASRWHAAGDTTRGGAMSSLVAFAFVCLGIVVMFSQAGKGSKGWAPDIALFGAGWVALTLMAGAALGALHVFGDSPREQVGPAVTAVVLLLTVTAAGRRAEYGRFSIFLGRGLGGRIARRILPIVLVLPLSRELMRTRLIRNHVFPEHYAAALLAAAGTMIALGLLLWVSWQFRRLEWEIQSMSLKDELTGLYNLRGFQLLAEQALRMARRSRMPFSVLFVDVDNLKQINDRLGHAAGSQLLVEAAEFLKTNFRETDVMGRIGGDEFAVAGQFSPDAIARAETQLNGDCSERAFEVPTALSLSMGHVTSDPLRNESLEDLLERADAAMYVRKRMKKLQTI
jgi:diguanylate cyclase (GGDEF)-like protein